MIFRIFNFFYSKFSKLKIYNKSLWDICELIQKHFLIKKIVK